MAKPSVNFVCTNCGATSGSWAGKCYQCGEWNTLEEQAEIVTSLKGNRGHTIQPTPLAQVTRVSPEKRLTTKILEVDDVLGGGFVPGSVTLIAGQPGIGKSTLLLQIADALGQNNSVLYCSGEESTHQVGLRARRLNATSKGLALASSVNAEDIATSIASKNYNLVVVDSIQTLQTSVVSSAPGTISQITNSTHLISEAAKASNTAIVIVGHVTKEGSIAGPKVLEHVVDVVLQLEGDRYGGFKLLRSVKNRYGSTNEAGIFEMRDSGLQPVDNPSAALLSERQVNDGSIVLATLEGTRPVLVEVQALVNKTSYGYPKRAASGIDLNRVNLLVAMLERRTKLSLAEQDIYVNIVGGIKISEPAADLAICMAIASASKGMQLKKDAVVFGEVGLSGEVRHVPFVDKRIAEARKLGFKLVIGPKSRDAKSNSMLSAVKDVRSALNTFLEV